jgi:hypothetical protein
MDLVERFRVTVPNDGLRTAFGHTFGTLRLMAMCASGAHVYLVPFVEGKRIRKRRES